MLNRAIFLFSQGLEKIVSDFGAFSEESPAAQDKPWCGQFEHIFHWEDD